MLSVVYWANYRLVRQRARPMSREERNRFFAASRMGPILYAISCAASFAQPLPNNDPKEVKDACLSHV